MTINIWGKGGIAEQAFAAKLANTNANTQYVAGPQSNQADAAAISSLADARMHNAYAQYITGPYSEQALASSAQNIADAHFKYVDANKLVDERRQAVDPLGYKPINVSAVPYYPSSSVFAPAYNSQAASFWNPDSRPGYAGGGAVSIGQAQAQLPQSVPNNDYVKYVNSARSIGMVPLPPEQAIPAIAQMRTRQQMALMQQVINGGTMPQAQQGYAMGGMVDGDEHQIVGPGTGKSDSIPAIIDGAQPSAVSNGEIHLPKHVVDYYGTKMLDALVEKAKLATKSKRLK